jgi:AcrR family transcriptional regulator
MGKIAQAKAGASTAVLRPPGRSGRPPKELAGEVEERILDAARQVFLEQGFEGASIEEIAVSARSGKPTIYARFGNKEALFAAVVTRAVVTRIDQFTDADVPRGDTTREWLMNMAVAVTHWTLTTDRIALLRLAIGEARRFPDLAASVGRMARERGSATVAKFLAEFARSDELGALPALAPEHLAATTRFFLDLAVLPLLLRALLEEDLDALHAEVGEHAARSIAFFLAACREGSGG